MYFYPRRWGRRAATTKTHLSCSGQLSDDDFGSILADSDFEPAAIRCPFDDSALDVYVVTCVIRPASSARSDKLSA